MRLLLKALVVLAPIGILVFGLQLCTQNAVERWLMRVRAVDELATLGLDLPGVIAIAPDAAQAQEAGEFAVDFRASLADNFSDLLGRGSNQRFILVIFSAPEMVREYAGRKAIIDRKALGGVVGYTDPTKNAVFLPPEADFITLRHEIVHLLMAQATEGRVRFSPWLNEGLAQFFERYNPPAPPSFPPASRALVRTMLGGQPLDLMRLLKLQNYNQFLRESGQRNYFEAQVLISYLIEHRRDALIEYIDAEKTHLSSRYGLFVEIVGDPLGKLGRDVQAYLDE